MLPNKKTTDNCPRKCVVRNGKLAYGQRTKAVWEEKRKHCACLLPQHRACAYVSKEKKWLWGNDTFHTISFTQSHGPCSVCFTQRFGGLRRGAEGDQIFICLKKEEELLLFSTTNWTIANLSVDSFNIETCTSSLLGDFQAEWMFHTHTRTHAPR